MDVQLIDCKLIDLPPTDTSRRTFSKEFAIELAASLKAEGMYSPPLVRPHPTKPGRFIMVAGRHRFFAWWQILKKTHIEVIVRTDMDESDAAMASVAENLWRKPLTHKQHLTAVKEWFDYFAAKNPSKIGSGGAHKFDLPALLALTERREGPHV
jgi:ParB family chromosome partitioning protein